MACTDDLPAPDRPRGLVSALAAATPPERDRTVDALRAVAIAVVVLWHWTFSVTHWDDGRLVMPNPIGDVPGLWLATWVLQVMPLFFVVGGYAHLAAWEAAQRTGAGDAGFLRTRAARLLRPAAALIAGWGAVEAVRVVAAPELPSLLQWGVVVLVPLWFLGTYLLVAAAVPLTARLHRRHGVGVVAALGVVVAAADVARLGHGIDGPVLVRGVGVVGLVGSLAVWLFAHQLGYLWRDGALDRRVAAALVVGALVALVGLTELGPYPRSMVAVRGEASNLFPTAAPVAVLAVLQLGLVGLLRDRLAQWLERPAAWRATIAVNAVAMTVFCWHMTALVGAIGVWHLVGGTLQDEPTGQWWLTRPLWVVLPGLLLVPLVLSFHRLERPRRPARQVVALSTDAPGAGRVR